MKHIALLLLLGIGGYFVWQYMGNANRVTTQIFLRKHLPKVLFIVASVIAIFSLQAMLGSTKFF